MLHNDVISRFNDSIDFLWCKHSWKIPFTFHGWGFLIIPGNLQDSCVEKLDGGTIVVMSFRGSALQMFHGKKGIRIPKCKVYNRLIGAAQEFSTAFYILEESKNCATALAGHRAAILFNRNFMKGNG